MPECGNVGSLQQGLCPTGPAWGTQISGVTAAGPQQPGWLQPQLRDGGTQDRKGSPLLSSKGAEFGHSSPLCCTSAQSGSCSPPSTPTADGHCAAQEGDTAAALPPASLSPASPSFSAREQQTHTYPRYQRRYPHPRGCHGSPTPPGRPIC